RKLTRGGLHGAHQGRGRVPRRRNALHHGRDPMTATTATTSHPGSQLTLARVVRSEWIKFTSLRSTYWTSGIIVLLWIGIALLLATTATFTTMGPDGQQVPITDDMRQYVTMAPVTGGVVFGM